MRGSASQRFALAVVTLAPMVASVTVAEEGSPSSFAGAPRPTVPLVWIDPAGVAAGLEAVARDEARSLLSRMGASASWRRERPGGPARPGEVRIILLDRAAEAGKTPILGATPPKFDGAPFLWVHLPNVRAAIGLNPRGGTVGMEPPMLRGLGIAVGRVIAHEVVHALAPSVPHGKGLMSALLTRAQLTAASVAIEADAALGVQAALRGDPFLLRTPSGVMAAAVSGEDLRR
jgi:hypothetical protein